MATRPEPIDPVHEELERLLADPTVQARLEDFEKRRQEGDLHLVSHEEVRRRLGLDPQPPTA